MAGALAGTRVIEAGLLVQGPQAAATLGEWGAAVIKVELPGIGDQSRWLPLAPGDTRSGYFIGCNRGKRSLTLDLRVPDGRDLFLRLVEQADVVITNFKPGTMDDWGLGYDAVSARNPRIVYAVGSTFGSIGPDVQREGADLSAQAAGGLISTTGRNPSESTPVGVTIADHIASQNLVSGILAALLHREKSGRGQKVETSLLGSQIWAQAAEYTRTLLLGTPNERSSHGHPMIPGVYGIFSTADGWLAIVGAAGPAREKLFDVIGAPELVDTPIFLWGAEKAAVFARMDAGFATRTTAEWCTVLMAEGIRHAAVRNHAEVVADPSVWENGYLVKVDGPNGPVANVAAPVRFSETPATTPAVAPELGQHTEEVLLELGLDWDEIAALQESRVI